MIGLPFLLGFLCYALGNKPLGFAFFMSIPIIIIAIINSEMKQKRTLERFDTLMKWIKNHKKYNEFECYDLFEEPFSFHCRYCTNFDKMFWRHWTGYYGYNKDNLGYSDVELSKCNKWSIEEQNVFFYKLKERCEQLKQENKI